jgi:hypothetical protein
LQKHAAFRKNTRHFAKTRGISQKHAAFRKKRWHFAKTRGISQKHAIAIHGEITSPQCQDAMWFF